MTKKSNKRVETRFTRNPAITITVVLLLFIIVMDVVAGFIFIPKDYNTFRRRHPYYHHDFFPNRQAVTKWGNREYNVYTNSLAFRDGSVRDIPLQSDKKRVVFIGDSYLEGLGVSWEHTLTGIIQERLKREQPGTEILNASAVSYSPLLYYLKTKYLVEKTGLRFDELFVFIDISDIQDEVLYKDFQPSEPSFFTALSSGALKFLKRHSFIAHTIDKLKKKDSQIDNAFYAEEMANIDVWMENIEELRNQTKPTGRFFWTLVEPIFEKWGKTGLKLAGENMKRLTDLCTVHDIVVHIVIYPSPPQIVGNDLNSKQVQYWEAFCLRHRLNFINLFPDFIENQDTEETVRLYFIPGDTHWNEEGHAKVSDRLYPYVAVTPEEQTE